MGKSMEKHMGKWWFNGGLMGFYGILWDFMFMFKKPMGVPPETSPSETHGVGPELFILVVADLCHHGANMDP